jgi:hypothetical protein
MSRVAVSPLAAVGCQRCRGCLLLQWRVSQSCDWASRLAVAHILECTDLGCLITTAASHAHTQAAAAAAATVSKFIVKALPATHMSMCAAQYDWQPCFHEHEFRHQGDHPATRTSTTRLHQLQNYPGALSSGVACPAFSPPPPHTPPHTHAPHTGCWTMLSSPQQ